MPLCMQDDTYTESYISTIGVDFVSIQEALSRCNECCCTAVRECGWKGKPDAFDTCSCTVVCAVTSATLLISQPPCLAPACLQKIRTVELDGKVIKLQIVSACSSG